MTGQKKDDRANQMNPNNHAYWESRGWDKRPDDWKERVSRSEEALNSKR